MTQSTLGDTPSHGHKGDDIDGDTDSTLTEVEPVAASLCCLQGCLAASAVGFAFFVGLPSGILLVFYASNTGDTTLLAVGGCLIVLPVITLVAFVVLCLYKRRLAMLASRVKASKKEQGGENSRF